VVRASAGSRGCTSDLFLERRSSDWRVFSCIMMMKMKMKKKDGENCDDDDADADYEEKTINQPAFWLFSVC
jgi:hypothetical protein